MCPKQTNDAKARADEVKAARQKTKPGLLTAFANKVSEHKDTRLLQKAWKATADRIDKIKKQGKGEKEPDYFTLQKQRIEHERELITKTKVGRKFIESEIKRIEDESKIIEARLNRTINLMNKKLNLNALKNERKYTRDERKMIEAEIKRIEHGRKIMKEAIKREKEEIKQVEALTKSFTRKLKQNAQQMQKTNPQSKLSEEDVIKLIDEAKKQDLGSQMQHALKLVLEAREEGTPYGAKGGLTDAEVIKIIDQSLKRDIKEQTQAALEGVEKLLKEKDTEALSTKKFRI